MKTSAGKTSITTTPATAHKVAGFAKAGSGTFFAPRPAGAAVQAKLSVNQPGDSFEREADRMADKVVHGPAPVVSSWAGADGSSWAGPGASGVVLPEERRWDKSPQLMRKETGAAPALDSATQSALNAGMAGGRPLSGEVRAFMEPRFGADFSQVRVHDDRESARLNNRLSARAFTYRNHVFFNENQYQPGNGAGKHLLAHELTHTIQQGHAVQRSPQVSTGGATPAIQRLGVQDALDYFADKAYYIPGFRMLSIVLGFNPINQRSADRSAANILRALIELIPGGALIVQALETHGVFTRAGAWVEQQLATLGDIGGEIVRGLARFIDSLSWTDIFHLGDVWDRAKAIFTGPIGRLIDFGAGVVTGLMALVREAVLRPLAALAEGTAGYDLLKAVLGQDPVTGDPVQRSPGLLIGGFMKLIGQEEVWENIQKGNAIGRAWAWFQGALEGLMGFVRAIPGQIVATLRSITWQDVLTITGLFSKVGRAFLNIAGQFFSWAGAQVMSLLEIIFSVVAPRAVPYIKKAQGAFRSIIKNPVGFVGNLVRAGKRGFQRFSANIGEHLKTALVKWITGPLAEAGVYIPKSFTLLEIVKLVLSVLGLTWQNIRAKLVKIIPEPVLVLLEKSAKVLVTLVRDGPAAAWEEIKNELNEMKDSMIAKVTEMVTTEVVKAAVTKLVSMINPAGAVIQAIIAIYNTITFFVQKINQIGMVVAAFIDSIAAIAAGQVEGAAKKVEQTMANALTVVIAFLAKFAGLGGIPDKLVGIVKKIRAPIDKGLDKIVAWLGGLLAKIGAGVKRLLNWWKKKVPVTGGDEPHTLTFQGEGKAANLVLRSEPMLPSKFLEETAERAAVTGSDRTGPVNKVRKQEKDIKTLQDQEVGRALRRQGRRLVGGPRRQAAHHERRYRCRAGQVEGEGCHRRQQDQAAAREVQSPAKDRDRGAAR
jgi:dolichol kinase